MEIALYRGQVKERYPDIAGTEVLVEKTDVTDLGTKTKIYYIYNYHGRRVPIAGYYLSDFREATNDDLGL